MERKGGGDGEKRRGEMERKGRGRWREKEGEMERKEGKRSAREASLALTPTL